MSKEQKYTKGFVTSKDGTTIGYRQMGSGPGLILLHGGISSSQYFMKLGAALSDEFTVYIPDRRGRGLSGAFGDNYGLQREVEDLDAILKKTDAHYLFGGSSGGLIALQASITLSSIKKIVTYEPLVYVNKSEMDKFNEIVQRFEKQLAEGDVITAMITAMDVNSEVDPDQKSPLANHLPSIILKPIFSHVLASDEKNIKGDDVTLKDLMPTLKYDIQLVNETEGKLQKFKKVQSEILLLNGSKSPLFLKNSTEALNKVLPHTTHKELPGLNHDSAQNYGKPEIIAKEIKHFLE
ncbi:alpha/beta fold hydrolase [Methanobacterium spitsbergense]|uniref:Alpha/beta hydrolase n=1 Tax=Methanobacterium spitsbergense TaxID=2874285 RepID=A0A8T5V0W2_9EURY|nr:alpha/beta hydrolase [Methanobacterium spitsbergense]MBZ2166663.1 alpha/beta hydrolase [Methanobacterium spitsbergense]